MASGKERVIQAVQECNESGYTREDGKWVDPIPVQKVAIEEGFRAVIRQNVGKEGSEDFDLWKVINPKVALREGNTIAENFSRAFNQWANQAEKALAESPVVDELQRKAEEYEQTADD